MYSLLEVHLRDGIASKEQSVGSGRHGLVVGQKEMLAATFDREMLPHAFLMDSRHPVRPLRPPNSEFSTGFRDRSTDWSLQN